MRENVSDEVMYLENVITKALVLLTENKVEEAKELLEKENELINESYE
ncbi:MAG: hypothetical protein ACLR02_09710 [Clostridium sp.]